MKVPLSKHVDSMTLDAPKRFAILLNFAGSALELPAHLLQSVTSSVHPSLLQSLCPFAISNSTAVTGECRALNHTVISFYSLNGLFL